MIPFRRDGDRGRLYLVLHSATVRNPRAKWEFPKGGMETGETTRETAAREFQEETGLADWSFREGFERSLSYTYVRRGRKVLKTVTYYLVEVKDDAPPIRSSEHVEDPSGHWYPLGHLRRDQPPALPRQDPPGLRRGGSMDRRELQGSWPSGRSERVHPMLARESILFRRLLPELAEPLGDVAVRVVVGGDLVVVLLGDRLVPLFLGEEAEVVVQFVEGGDVLHVAQPGGRPRSCARRACSRRWP